MLRARYLGSLKTSRKQWWRARTSLRPTSETNLVKETTSGPDGEYRLLALPAGTYKVTASATGFQDFEATGIDVKVNDRLKIDVVLEVGTIKQAVSVEANSVQVETESTQLGRCDRDQEAFVAAVERAQLHRSAGSAGWRDPSYFRIDPAGPAGIGRSFRRQRVGQRTARNCERFPGEWQRRERREGTWARVLFPTWTRSPNSV